MKLIKQLYEIIPQALGLEGIYRQIEIAGRTCYKSHENMTNDSAEDFVNRMVASKHNAMLEHGTVYLRFAQNDGMNSECCQTISHKYDFYCGNPYSKAAFKNGNVYVTTNYRVLIENGRLEDLEYQCEHTEYHKKRVTVRFITDQGILREFTRHRAFSFAVESSRYCNYSKNKFNNEITYIIPCWCRNIENNAYYDVDVMSNRIAYTVPEKLFLKGLLKTEEAYLALIQIGYKPQDARNILPLATKCEMVMTGFIDDWKHFFKLRCASNAHPQARELVIPLEQEFEVLGYV